MQSFTLGQARPGTRGPIPASGQLERPFLDPTHASHHRPWMKEETPRGAEVRAQQLHDPGSTSLSEPISSLPYLLNKAWGR